MFGSEFKSSTVVWSRSWIERKGLLSILRVHAHHLGVICSLTSLYSILWFDESRLTKEALLSFLRLLIVNFKSCKFLPGATITCLRLSNIVRHYIGIYMRVDDAWLWINLRWWWRPNGLLSLIESCPSLWAYTLLSSFFPAFAHYKAWNNLILTLVHSTVWSIFPEEVLCQRYIIMVSYWTLWFVHVARAIGLIRSVLLVESLISFLHEFRSWELACWSIFWLNHWLVENVSTFKLVNLNCFIVISHFLINRTIYYARGGSWTREEYCIPWCSFSF